MISERNRIRASVALAFLCAGLAAFAYSSRGGPAQTAHAAQTAQSQPPAYTLFESGQVRPLALSPDGGSPAPETNHSGVLRARPERRGRPEPRAAAHRAPH